MRHDRPCPTHPRPHDRRSVRGPGPPLRYLRDHDARDLRAVLSAAGPSVPALHSPVDPAAVRGQGPRLQLVTRHAAGALRSDPERTGGVGTVVVSAEREPVDTHAVGGQAGAAERQSAEQPGRPLREHPLDGRLRGGHTGGHGTLPLGERLDGPRQRLGDLRGVGSGGSGVGGTRADGGEGGTEGGDTEGLDGRLLHGKCVLECGDGKLQERSMTVNAPHPDPQTPKCGHLVKARPHSVPREAAAYPSEPTEPLVGDVC
ncbi:protein of unknown function [Streptomyces murinus]